MVDAKTVGKTGMRGPRIDKLGKAQLLDASQALKVGSLNDAPERLIKLLLIKSNEIVQWVANPLWLAHRHV